jgi:hypothetical protein
MLLYFLLFFAGLATGLLVLLITRSALKQEMLAAAARNDRDQQTIASLQTEKEQILGRALHAEGSVKYLEQ